MCFLTCEVYEYRFHKGLLGVGCVWIYTPSPPKNDVEQSDCIFRLPSVHRSCVYVTDLILCNFGHSFLQMS